MQELRVGDENIANFFQMPLCMINELLQRIRPVIEKHIQMRQALDAGLKLALTL